MLLFIIPSEPTDAYAHALRVACRLIPSAVLLVVRWNRFVCATQEKGGFHSSINLSEVSNRVHVLFRRCVSSELKRDNAAKLLAGAKNASRVVASRLHTPLFLIPARVVGLSLFFLSCCC